MAYNIPQPLILGKTTLKNINMREIIEFIDWKFFFHAWRVPGKYDGIEKICECVACKEAWLKQFENKNREKAEEAIKLLKDAKELLREMEKSEEIELMATVCLTKAKSENDDIIIDFNGGQVVIPTLRQQKPSNDGYCYALSDFISEKDDYIGLFATSVKGSETLAKLYEKLGDDYQSILVKTVSDRIAEATTEWLHYKVRTEYWGYDTNEKRDIKRIIGSQYIGIRPAVGYPSLPDQSIIFEMDKILSYSDIGITLTENGAMYPNASVSGLYFSHPKSRYFNVGTIDEEQLQDYSKRRKYPIEQMRKWLISNM